ncbi:MAG: hypothetical protein JSW60_09340, partial [Thermoplasmatales archaeon]
MEHKKLGFLDYLLILLKWKKLILINFFVVCFIAAAISLIVSKWFTSTAVILPPTAEASSLGISSIIGGSLSSLGGLGGMAGAAEEVARFMSILESRTLMETVIKKFNLMERYGDEDMEAAVESLRSRLSIDINDNGTIQISAMAKTPFLPSNEEEDEARTLATDIANFIVETLDNMNTKFKVEKAKNTRVFLEKRYNQTMEDLAETEEKFKKFQEQYKAISLPEQTQAAITV